MTSDQIVAAALGLTLTGASMRVNPKLASSIVMDLGRQRLSANATLDMYVARYPNLPVFELDKLLQNTAIVQRTIDAGIHVIAISDNRYPWSLAAIDDPPPVLFLRGDVQSLGFSPGLAVVGTRKATRNGLVVAERIASHFASKEWIIVSGLALGIDAAAHKGALSVNGRTIAVLAHGLDEVYPKTNKNLADEILQKNGALVSEYPMGHPARPEQFVLRNRIQIGLSAGSVIVEGEENSGTKTQAEYCLRNGRELFAVIPTDQTSSLNLASSLPRILVEKRGATAVRSRTDYDVVERMILAKRKQLISQIPVPF